MNHARELVEGSYPGDGRRGAALARIGGGLGVAACLIGVTIFIAGCFGFTAALAFSPVPAVLALPGLGLTIVGGIVRRSPDVEDTHVLAGIFLNVAALFGSLVLIAFWRGWPTFNMTA